MTDTPNLSRRFFLIGTAAAVASVPAARILKAAPLLTSRAVYDFTVLPNPLDQTPAAEQRVFVMLDLEGEVLHLNLNPFDQPTFNLYPFSELPRPNQWGESLKPGAYRLQWFGEGKVRVRGAVNGYVFAYPGNSLIRRVAWFPNRLSDETLAALRG